MRFLHTSDWHLGRTLHGADLQPAHEAYLDHLVELARAERVDAVLVSGDVYDRPVPPLDAVRLLDDALGRLSEVAHVVLISGNHDSATRLGFGSALLQEQVHVRTVAARAGEPVLLPGSSGVTAGRVFCLPYLDPDLVRHALGEQGPEGEQRPVARSHHAVLTAAMTRVRDAVAASEPVPTVVMAHAFIAGGEPSASEREITVGGVSSVPAGVLAAEGVDYVALGHLHGPQDIRAALPVRYSGSPVPFSFSEKDQVKGTLLVEIGSEGMVREERIEAPVLRRLAELRGRVAELTDGRFAAHAKDYVTVRVTDQVRPEHLFAQVKEAFPHALEVLHTPPVPADIRGVSHRAAAADPAEVLDAFVTQVQGAPPSPAEARVLREAWEAAIREGASA